MFRSLYVCELAHWTEGMSERRYSKAVEDLGIVLPSGPPSGPTVERRVVRDIDDVGEGMTVAAIEASYETVDGDGKNLTDEFILPTVTLENEGRISDGDSVVFFNFRPDRAREITRTFVDPDFSGFERKYFPVNYVCMTQYDATMPNVDVAFKPETLKNTFGEYLANNGMTQLRIAETEKYAHVTFFFNGGVEAVNEGEDRILIPSPKVATYDLQPEMSAYLVSEKLNEAVRSLRSTSN